MADDVKKILQKAQEAVRKLDTLRTEADFHDAHDDKIIRYQLAMLRGLEALYHQNEAIVELLKGRASR